MAEVPASQNTNQEARPKSAMGNENIMTEVINGENEYIKARREKAAHEFVKIKANEQYEKVQGQEYGLTDEEYKKILWYVDLLKASPSLSEIKTKAHTGMVRPTIGMAFSGGGIRSATFCLGVAQGLSRFGVLPWVDYLTSVSGGGFMAGCMTSLLSHEEKKIDYGKKPIRNEKDEERYYPFNVFWERFPFNPDLQVFDKDGVAYADQDELPKRTQQNASDVDISLRKSNEKERNRQLMHMRNLGNYLIPRMGLLTIDTIRGFGAFLLRIVYTLLVFFVVMLIIGSIHYAVTAAFTPEIMQTGQVYNSQSMLTLLFAYGDGTFPWGVYGKALLAGFLFSYVMALIVSFSYRKDPTTENRYRFWELPSVMKVVSTYSRLVIRGIIFTTAVLMAILILCSVLFLSTAKSYLVNAQFYSYFANMIWLGLYLVMGIFLLYSYFKKEGWLLLIARFFIAGAAGYIIYNIGRAAGLGAVNVDAVSAQGYFYFAMLILFGLYFLAGIYLLAFYMWDESWAKQGLREQEWIDGLVTIMVILLTFWTMILVLGWLKINEGFDENFRLYWIWTPAIFMFGGGWGLVLLQYSHFLEYFPGLITKRVDPPAVYNDESIFQYSVFLRGILKYFARKYLEKISAGRDIPDNPMVSRWKKQSFYMFNIWSNPDFRSIFWVMQGSFMYGTLVFILLGIIMVPHYFSSQVDPKTQTYVSLSVAIVSGMWSSYLASSGKSQIFSWLIKIFSLPPELEDSLLAILVFFFNLSALFLVEIGLDALPSFFSAWTFHWEFFLLALIAVILLGFLGLIDINHLSAHYFFRDRLSDAYLRTEVDDAENHRENHSVGIPRDDRDRLASRIQRGECSAPYHIVMTTINLPGSWFLQFKDRKSQPFIFSKLYTGSNVTGYVKTEKYRDNNTKYSQALALSGAAVSSGLGHLTFFAQAFVVTLFNLRLGMWLDNPMIYKKEEKIKEDAAKKKDQKAKEDVKDKVQESLQYPMDKRGPWLLYLWDEMRGRMSDRRPLVNITDGAHTEDNIGVYPLFQRRCKYIIACDAGEDPEGKCTELVAVIRQVNVDFGVTVDINVKGLKPGVYDKEKNMVTESETHFAIGRIEYPPTTEYPKMTGWLIYFRPSILKNDPASILQYWQCNKFDFPHPSTADQFFDEEQFEVMRLLGEWTVFSALKQTVDKLSPESSGKGITKRERLAYTKFLKGITQFDASEEIPTSFELPEKKFSKFEKLIEDYHRLTSS